MYYAHVDDILKCLQDFPDFVQPVDDPGFTKRHTMRAYLCYTYVRAVLVAVTSATVTPPTSLQVYFKTPRSDLDQCLRPQLVVAAIAASSPTTLRLRTLFASLLNVLPNETALVPGVQRASSHFRKQTFISLGAPSTTTVEMGTNGLSSNDAAKMP